MGSGQDQNSPGQILHPIAIVGILNSKELGRYPSVTPGGCSPQGFSLELALLTSCSFPHMIHVSSISVLCIFGFILTASRIDLSGAHCLAFQVFWIQVEAFWPNNSGILHSLAQHGWCHYLPPTGKVSRIFFSLGYWAQMSGLVRTMNQISTNKFLRLAPIWRNSEKKDFVTIIQRSGLEGNISKVIASFVGLTCLASSLDH